MIDTILYAILSAIIIFLAYYIFIQGYRIRKARLDLAQKDIDLNIAIERINDLVELELLVSNPDKDFVRFLSESREQAFSYIEDVQLAIASLSKAIADQDPKSIIEAQKSLLSMLPQNMIN